ncbi:MAG: hypothetical protein A2Y14_01310 [Verrucomicrobia bacterium GWF2_51_19]|nr:MAG: hypothetical protein A2Y14_01310 [Verrucomicrobia bacterium GWF2_51_19]HCJ11714.1 hypothetical protein [Opitutae bacterium]
MKHFFQFLFHAFLNVSIRRKLFTFSLLYVVLIFGIIVFFLLSFAQIEKSYDLKERAYQLIRLTQNARISEKSYLQYYDSRHATQLMEIQKNIEMMVQDLSLILSNRDNLNTFRGNLEKYESIFGAIVETHNSFQQLSTTFNFKIEQVNLAAQEANKFVNEKASRADKQELFEVLNYTNQCYNLALELQGLYRNFLLDGDLKDIQKYKSLLKDKLVLYTERLSVHPSMQKFEKFRGIVKTLLESMASFKDIPDKALALFNAEQKNILELDSIGNVITLTADAFLAEANYANRLDKRQLIANISLLTVSGIVVAIGFSLVLMHLLMTALNSLIYASQKLEEGDLTVRIPIFSKDEIGQTSAKFNQFIEKFQGIIRNLDTNTHQLGDASFNLTETSQQMYDVSERMNSQASRVAKAGGDLSANIEFMAASAEEISALANSVSKSVQEINTSLNEVAKSCSKESEIAAKANQKADEAMAIIRDLGVAAEQVNEIVEIISDVANQTTLLALNANIEAADAGDRGKGFTVVANEIQALAQRSAKSTIQVTNRIKKIQKDVKKSVYAMSEVSKIIGEVSKISESITVSIEEQSATINEVAKSVSSSSEATSELARNIQESSKGANEVSENIQGVSSATDSSTASAQATYSSAEKLSQVSNVLRKIVRQFRV